MKRLLTLRSLCSIIIGALLCAFPYDMAATLVTAIGILFLLSGLISTIAFFYTRHREPLRILYPILGIGSALFGILLCILATTLGRYIAYLLAAFLIIAAIIQLISMLRLKAHTHVEAFFILIPLLVIIANILIFILPQSWIGGTTDPDLRAQAVRLTIVGTTSIIYGIYSLLTAVRFRRLNNPTIKPTQDEGQVVDFQEVNTNSSLPTTDKEDHSRFTPN